MAVCFNHPAIVKRLAAAIFSPQLWRGKTLADIQEQAELVYKNIEYYRPEPQNLRQARLVLFDHAMTCWEHVRPDPPKITISTVPAKGKSL
jgi:hypothetical protein